jgi:hypothetical protein
MVTQGMDGLVTADGPVLLLVPQGGAWSAERDAVQHLLKIARPNLGSASPRSNEGSLVAATRSPGRRRASTSPAATAFSKRSRTRLAPASTNNIHNLPSVMAAGG